MTEHEWLRALRNENINEMYLYIYITHIHTYVQIHLPYFAPDALP